MNRDLIESYNLMEQENKEANKRINYLSFENKEIKSQIDFMKSEISGKSQDESKRVNVLKVKCSELEAQNTDIQTQKYELEQKHKILESKIEQLQISKSGQNQFNQQVFLKIFKNKIGLQYQKQYEHQHKYEYGFT